MSEEEQGAEEGGQQWQGGQGGGGGVAAVPVAGVVADLHLLAALRPARLTVPAHVRRGARANQRQHLTRVLPARRVGVDGEAHTHPRATLGRRRRLHTARRLAPRGLALYALNATRLMCQKKDDEGEDSGEERGGEGARR